MDRGRASASAQSGSVQLAPWLPSSLGLLRAVALHPRCRFGMSSHIVGWISMEMKIVGLDIGSVSTLHGPLHDGE